MCGHLSFRCLQKRPSRTPPNFVPLSLGRGRHLMHANGRVIIIRRAHRINRTQTQNTFPSKVCFYALRGQFISPMMDLRGIESENDGDRTRELLIYARLDVARIECLNLSQRPQTPPSATLRPNRATSFSSRRWRESEEQNNVHEFFISILFSSLDFYENC